MRYLAALHPEVVDKFYLLSSTCFLIVRIVGYLVEPFNCFIRLETIQVNKTLRSIHCYSILIHTAIIVKRLLSATLAIHP